MVSQDEIATRVVRPADIESIIVAKWRERTIFRRGRLPPLSASPPSLPRPFPSLNLTPLIPASPSLGLRIIHHRPRLIPGPILSHQILPILAPDLRHIRRLALGADLGFEAGVDVVLLVATAEEAVRGCVADEDGEACAYDDDEGYQEAVRHCTVLGVMESEGGLVAGFLVGWMADLIWFVDCRDGWKVTSLMEGEVQVQVRCCC